jgi:glycosidase
VKSDDGISVEEQQNDPNSLLSTYKSLIKLRKEHPVLINGSYQSLNNSSKDVVSFYRINDNTKALVVINLSANEENIELPLEKGNPNLVYGENKGSFKDGKLEVVISGSATQVWLMK